MNELSKEFTQSIRKKPKSSIRLFWGMKVPIRDTPTVLDKAFNDLLFVRVDTNEVGFRTVFVKNVSICWIDKSDVHITPAYKNKEVFKTLNRVLKLLDTHYYISRQSDVWFINEEA